jgi:hypothetical protein
VGGGSGRRRGLRFKYGRGLCFKVGRDVLKSGLRVRGEGVSMIVVTLAGNYATNQVTARRHPTYFGDFQRRLVPSQNDEEAKPNVYALLSRSTCWTQTLASESPETSNCLIYAILAVRE